MGRHLQLAMATLQCVFGIALLCIGCLLPSRQQVVKPFSDAANIIQKVRNQLALVREETQRIRGPELPDLITKLQGQVRLATKTMNERQIDFQSVAEARDALQALSEGLNETRGALDKQLPKINSADADAAIDSVRSVRDSLGAYDEGLVSLQRMLDIKFLETWKPAIVTARDRARSAANHASRRIPGTDRTILPAQDLQNFADGLDGTVQECDTIIKSMPAIHQSLDETRKVMSGTRTMLDTALKRQTELKEAISQGPHLATNAAKIISASAKALQLSSDQLGQVVERRDEYQQAMKQATDVDEALDRTLELSRKTIQGLHKHEESLGVLHDSLQSIEQTAPDTAAVAERLLGACKIVVWIMGLMAVTIGVYLVVGLRWQEQSGRTKGTFYFS